MTALGIVDLLYAASAEEERLKRRPPRHISTPHAVKGVTIYEALDAEGAPIEGPTVAVMAVVHGNEPVGDAVLGRLATSGEAALTRGRLIAIRANLEAAALNLRYTPKGTNLNRLWDEGALARIAAKPKAARCYEERRALTLAPLLLRADAVLDLHSTSQPAPPFLIFRDDQRHAQVAFKLGVARLVTGVHEAAILDGGLSPDVGLRPGERSPRLGFTFEAGQHDDPVNVDRAWLVMARLLDHLGMWGGELPPLPSAPPMVYEVIERFRQAPWGQPAYRFVGYEGGEPGGGRRGPPRRLASFEQIEPDEVILKRGETTVIRAAEPFTMLMPTPTAAPGSDLYYVTQRRHGGMGVHEAPRTDEEARREAWAIERMLDLTDDDAYERGETVAVFDNRMVHDIVAAEIMRCVRLPEGHPHRRIAVVGRGDRGGDEQERRSGVRYRRAMDRALRLGVPVDRYQLMRGASLSWLDALCSPKSEALLQARRAAAPEAAPVRFFISTRQPHTVSLLIIGDLERALREGDHRHARIVIVVEGAMVEPNRGGVAIRTHRLGIASARPDITRAVSALLATLRAEHDALMRRPELAQDPDLQAALGPDGALHVDANLETLTRMRRGLRRVQVDLYQRLLRGAVTPGERIPDEAALGPWLARTMTATGARDAEALRRMLRPLETGYVVEPRRLEDLRADEAPLSPQRPQRTPRQALSAADVTADTLERYVGWRRYLRGGQRIPGTRGKDVTLTLTAEELYRHVSQLYAHAVEQARRAPGRVMLVIAGEGRRPPQRETDASRGLLAAHQAALDCEALRYLRLQHAEGTHLSWLRGFVDRAARRPEGSAPLLFQWEAEHGSSVNVVLVCVREVETPPTPWSLEGWFIQRCGVALNPLKQRPEGIRVAMFTGLEAGAPRNQALVHYGRAHCQGLLAQGGARTLGRGIEDIDEVIVAQLERWLRRLRRLEGELPPPGEARVAWITQRLRLADARLAATLAIYLEQDTTAEAAARRIWGSVSPWPPSSHE